MNESIGIIAGGGQFPRLVAESARQEGLSVVICGFQGHTDPSLAEAADAFCLLHLGQFNKVIAFFRSHGVRRLCMAGAINKPRALDFRPDFRAARILFSLRRRGDDALLRAIMENLEAEGFSIMSASAFSSALHVPAGVLTRRFPTPEEKKAIAYGWPIAATLGRFDIGQCLVLKDTMVAAVECLEGTDATLRRGAQLGGAGCIAVKRVKPGQDERVDLPSVGLETVRLLIEHAYRCLVVEAGKTLFFDREKAVELANQHQLCILAVTEEDVAHFAAEITKSA